MGLIKENVNTQLDLIVSECFKMNRLLDRIVNQLDLHFIMSKTASIIHPKLAHIYPNPFADLVSEYQGSRNNPTSYGLTPLDNTVYTTPFRCFEKYLSQSLELEKVISDAMELSIDENDFYTQAFLQTFMMKIIPYTKQAQLLFDKAKLYEQNDDWMKFDTDIENFIIV